MCSKHSTNRRDKEVHEAFVAKQRSDLISLLQPYPGERILDVGCGNGELTAKIAAAGAIPTGIDLSEEMVRRAQQKYPDLNIQVGNICQYRTDDRFDAVFSNAVIHWIKDAASVVSSIGLALKEGGRFVAEFAGHGNVAVLTTAIRQELEAHGHAWEGRIPWYLPTIGEYASLLEQNGFRVTFARHFEQAAPLNGEEGIRNWLNKFADYFFPDVTHADQASMHSAIVAKVKPQLEREGRWSLDTSRLRIVGIKESV